MILNDGSQFTPEDADLSNWRSAYPGLDVDGEIQRMSVWLGANPAKRKTKSGIRRFVVSWLNRANETGGSPDLSKKQLDSIDTKIDPKQRDDVYHKLKEVMAFFTRDEMDRNKLSYWMKALDGFASDEICASLEDYVAIGKYAPKPRDILDILRERRQRNQASQGPQPCAPFTPPPEEARKAWMWYIATFRCGELTGTMFPGYRNVDPEIQDQYLEIVNREAAAANAPEAIGDDHKIARYWNNL